MPRNYFKSAVPDSEEFEGYTRNMSLALVYANLPTKMKPDRTMCHWSTVCLSPTSSTMAWLADPFPLEYFGSVLLLFQNANQTSIVTRVKGLPWVLEHHKLMSLNLDIWTAAVTAISCLKEVKPRSSSCSEPTLTDGAAEPISELALEWEDATLWCDVPTLDYASCEVKAKTVKEAAKLFDPPRSPS